MAKTTTIQLGGVDYQIDPLPIGILRALDEEFADIPLKEATPKEKEKFFFSQAVKIIYLGLKTRNPGITPESIEAIPSDMEEIFEARFRVLKHAGLMVEKTTKVGESPAVAS